MKGRFVIWLLTGIVACVMAWVIIHANEGEESRTSRAVAARPKPPSGSPGPTNRTPRNAGHPPDKAPNRIQDSPEYLTLVENDKAIGAYTAIPLGGELSWQVKKSLSITREETARLEKGIKSILSKAAEWEAANGEVVPESGVIKFQPSGEVGRQLSEEFETVAVEVLGEARGAFFNYRCEHYRNIVTGRAGKAAKAIRASLRTPKDREEFPDNPYLIEEKILNRVELLSSLDWTNPATFQSDSVSNCYRSLTCKEVPSWYAHLVEAP